MTRVSAVLYAVAAVAMAAAAAGTRVELTLSAVGTFALFGVLIPAFAANSVMVLATRGQMNNATGWHRGLAFTVAAAGGVVSVGLL